MLRKGKIVFILTVVTILASAAVGSAAMVTPYGMMGGGSMMTSSGGFGMMNGMAGEPMVGSDGTAYIVTMMPSATPGTTPTTGSFESNMIAVTTSGQTVKMSVGGLMSKPVFANGIMFNGVTGDYMIATVSLPTMSDYSVMAVDGVNTNHSVVFWMQTPVSTSSVPMAIAMDGRYASHPMIANNQIYIMTTNNGNAMMEGTNVFSKTFPTYMSASTPITYLYVFKMDGTLVLRTQIQ